MARSNRHPRTRRDWRAAVLLVATCLALSMTVAAAPAASASAAPRATAGRLPQPVATTTRTLAHALSAAAGRARLAKRVLASRTRALKRCLREHRGHPVRCGAARRALRLAARRLAYARRRVSRIARAAGRARHAAAARPVSAAASPGAFEMGAVVGSAELYELPWLQALGARTARMEFAIDDPVSQLEPVVEAYARAGIRPLLLAGFQARIPSTAEARNLASWATAFGPGGTFWRGRNLPASTAVTSIEFGNETNNPYQFSETSEDWFDQPAFIARAEAYARRLRDAQTAIAQSGAHVGLLGIADQYGGHTTWVEAMFRAVPDLGRRVAGWTVHPYGADWRTPIDDLIAGTRAHGAPSDIPIYVTEWGLSTDDGRCLGDNFGWNDCMTYEEAANVLASTVGAMRSRYGSRLGAFYLFQARDQKPSGASTDREGYFGALRSDLAPKGAYTAEVRSLLTANP